MILTFAILFPFGRKENIEKAAKKADAEKVKEEKRRVYVLVVRGSSIVVKVAHSTT